MRRRLFLKSLGTMLVTASALIATPAHVTAQAGVRVQSRPVVKRPIPPAALKGALDFARTELFFGTARADAPPVTDEEFLAFLDDQVTPRFPDGLTLLKGDGQFRGEDGLIIKEDSFLLILLYPAETFVANSRKIDAIRELYKAQFQQESVLRVDDRWTARVSF